MEPQEGTKATAVAPRYLLNLFLTVNIVALSERIVFFVLYSSPLL